MARVFHFIFCQTNKNKKPLLCIYFSHQEDKEAQDDREWVQRLRWDSSYILMRTYLQDSTTMLMGRITQQEAVEEEEDSWAIVNHRPQEEQPRWVVPYQVYFFIRCSLIHCHICKAGSTSIRAVTVRQIINAYQSHSESEILIDGAEVGHVSSKCSHEIERDSFFFLLY